MDLVRRVGGARRHRRPVDARRRARTTACMAIVSEKGRTPSGPPRKIAFPVRSDLDVQQGRFVGRHICKRRFYGGGLGVIDGLKILVDRGRAPWRSDRRRVVSGLRPSTVWDNDHGLALLANLSAPITLCKEVGLTAQHFRRLGKRRLNFHDRLQKIYSFFERKPALRLAAAFNRTGKTNDLVHLFQPLGVEAEFLGHLDQLLRGFRILDGFGELPGSVGLIAVMIGLGHRSTFLDKCGLRQKGSMSGTRPDMAG